MYVCMVCVCVYVCVMSARYVLCVTLCLHGVLCMHVCYVKYARYVMCEFLLCMLVVYKRTYLCVVMFCLCVRYVCMCVLYVCFVC